MRDLCKFGFIVVMLSTLCLSQTFSSSPGDLAGPNKNVSEYYFSNITSKSQMFSLPEEIDPAMPFANTSTEETVLHSFIRRKQRSKKGKKMRKLRKGILTNEVHQLQSNETISKIVVNPEEISNHKVKIIRRRNKRRRRKLRKENSNKNKSVTTKGLPLLTDSKLSHPVINEIEGKTNGNLSVLIENSVIETSIRQSGGSKTATKPLSSKRKPKKRRRKNRKRRRKIHRGGANISETTTPNTNESKSSDPTIKQTTTENYKSVNIDEITNDHDNHTSVVSSGGLWLANLVAPIPTPSGKIALNNAVPLYPKATNRTNGQKVMKYNRCRKPKGNCAHICNPKGPTKCSCLEGFVLAEDGRSCLDVDECQINNGSCEMNCTNTLGSYECRCSAGLRLSDDLKSCEDINECLLRNGHGPCQDTCQNTYGSYKCSCQRLSGTKLGTNGHSCEDLNECAIDNGGCSHNCINTMGRAFCSCPDGMELSSDWKTCQDINECEYETVQKTCGDSCVNTVGSYQCLGLSDYQNDQPPVNIACSPLFPPVRGFISCSRKGAYKSYTKSGRKRTTNSPGTICKLTCPTGYRMVGDYHLTCGLYGKWKGNRDGKCIKASPPQLRCPTTQHYSLMKEEEEISLEFPTPVTNINWKYIKSNPPWAKDLVGILRKGEHNINFTVKDPSTQLFSSCTFKIIVS